MCSFPFHNSLIIIVNYRALNYTPFYDAKALALCLFILVSQSENFFSTDGTIRIRSVYFGAPLIVYTSEPLSREFTRTLKVFVLPDNFPHG